MNIADALDCYLNAQVRVGKWETEFIAKFYKPVIDTLINVALNNARTSPMFDQEKLMGNLSPEAQKVLRGE